MVPVQLFMLEDKIGYHCEDHKRDTLLNHLQLNQVEWTSIIYESYPVCWYLATVLEEGYHPRECYHEIQGPVGRYARLLQAQMAIPCECHKHIAQNEQEDSINSVYHISLSQNRCKDRYFFLNYQILSLFFGYLLKKGVPLRRVPRLIYILSV